MPNIKQHIHKWLKENDRVLESNIGDIALGKLIGQGGTALVFESDFMGGTAIKLLGESVEPKPSTRYKRFLSEYINLVRLVPTGAVVPLYHYGIQDMAGLNIPYIVMEQCAKTLDEQYRTDRLQDVDKFKRLLSRLLKVLEIVHEAGVIHRDIKPKNILLRNNGDWVLADFGISWFDPKFYEKLAKTRNSDRLANWQFSPPEQFRRDGYDQATPCLDLYALGQTLYHCVTGMTVRGSNHPHFSEVTPSLSDYDSLINKFVSQQPESRFQSVAEVYDYLKQQEQSKHALYLRLAKNQVQETAEFDRRLARAMPGSSGVSYTQAANQKEITRVLHSLAEDPEEYNLWWTQGNMHNSVNRLELISDDIWLLNCWECKVEDLWIYRFPTIERQYVIVHLAARASFRVNGTPHPETERESVGYYKGKYVTRAELADGYAIIDGEIVEISGAELRRRNLKDTFFILAPGTSVYLQPTADDEVYKTVESLCEAGKIVPSLLKPLESIERPLWMTIYD